MSPGTPGFSGVDSALEASVTTMTVNIKVGHRALVDAAEAEIQSLSPEEAARLQSEGTAILVDIRDVRELKKLGKVPGAEHMPRGMLEFWVDPESPYFKPIFHEDKSFVLYCGSGWRSALATKALQDMGLENVAHVAGGFTAWKEAGLPTEAP